MIRETDLLDAIAECQGERDPNAQTCIKLASYYTILDHITVPQEMRGYAYDTAPEYATPVYESESEFGQLVKEADAGKVLRVVDELMETLRIMQPKLYNAFMRELTAL